MLFLSSSCSFWVSSSFFKLLQGATNAPQQAGQRYHIGFVWIQIILPKLGFLFEFSFVSTQSRKCVISANPWICVSYVTIIVPILKPPYGMWQQNPSNVWGSEAATLLFAFWPISTEQHPFPKQVPLLFGFVTPNTV